MKISQLLAICSLAAVGGAGCITYGESISSAQKPSTGADALSDSPRSLASDASDAHADAALKDTAALSDTTTMPDLAADRVATFADTTTPADAVPTADAAIPTDAPTINDTPVLTDTPSDAAPDKPCINPQLGHYTARLDPALSNPGDSVSRLDSYGFTVGVDAKGLLWIDATYDGWAHYGFLVTCGYFNGQHGDGYDGYSGTNCPTDGFGMVGSFVSPTEAHGTYKAMFSCQIKNAGHFIATLDPGPAAAPPDTAALDLAAVDSGVSSDR